MTPLVQQRDLNKEAFLWYALTSPEYMDSAFERLKNVDAFLKELLTAHPIAENFQPAIFWGGVIEQLLGNYSNARAMLAHGEIGTMRDWCIKAADIERGFREQAMWMGKEEFLTLLERIECASKVCSDFMGAITMTWYFSSAGIMNGEINWTEYDRDDGYAGCSVLDQMQSLAEVTKIPEHQADLAVSIRTGQIVPWTGVWIPAGGLDTAALAFARQGQIMQPKYPVTHVDEDGYEYTEPVETAWHPVKPTGRTISLCSSPQETISPIPASNPCPKPGYWFTPAKQSSRRYFKQGDTFPEIEASAYGATFWQWSPDQSEPRL